MRPRLAVRLPFLGGPHYTGEQTLRNTCDERDCSLSKSMCAPGGARIHPAKVICLAGKHVPTEPTLQDNGWTRDGAIWAGYRVKWNILSSGVATAPPAAVRRMIGEKGSSNSQSTVHRSVGTFAVSRLGHVRAVTPFIGHRGVQACNIPIIALISRLTSE